MKNRKSKTRTWFSCSSPAILKNYPQARLKFCLRRSDSNFVVALLRLRRLRRKCELVLNNSLPKLLFKRAFLIFGMNTSITEALEQPFIVLILEIYWN